MIFSCCSCIVEERCKKVGRKVDDVKMRQSKRKMRKWTYDWFATNEALPRKGKIAHVLFSQSRGRHG